jgi:predicted transcriptional regulator
MTDTYLTEQELAVLLATRESENAQGLEQLAQAVESDQCGVQQVLASLVARDILEPLEQYDGSQVYGYTAAPWSQAIYEEIHRMGQA